MRCFFAFWGVNECNRDFSPIGAPGSRPSAIIHPVCSFGKSRMHETRQSRIARLTETIRRHRYTLVQGKRILKIVPPERKDEVLTQMREMEDKLREMEKELHDLYVQQIREESTPSPSVSVMAIFANYLRRKGAREEEERQPLPSPGPQGLSDRTFCGFSCQCIR